MKSWLIKMLLPKILELMIEALKTLASKTDNKIDDLMVESFSDNIKGIENEIKNIL